MQRRLTTEVTESTEEVTEKGEEVLAADGNARFGRCNLMGSEGRV